MEKYKIAVVLRSSKVIYFSQWAHSNESAVWIMEQVAEDRWGDEVVGVGCVTPMQSVSVAMTTWVPTTSVKGSYRVA